MLKKLQALKAKKGFTLVELIVVIAIIAVLAAILIPTLLNQVTNSRIVSADTTASTIRDVINAWIVEQNAQNGVLIKKGAYPGKGKDITLEASLGTIAGQSLSDALGNAYDFNSSNPEYYCVWVEDNKVVAVAFCASKAINPKETVENSLSISYTKASGWGSVTKETIENNLLGTYPKWKETAAGGGEGEGGAGGEEGEGT